MLVRLQLIVVLFFLSCHCVFAVPLSCNSGEDHVSDLDGMSSLKNRLIESKQTIKLARRSCKALSKGVDGWSSERVIAAFAPVINRLESDACLLKSVSESYQISGDSFENEFCYSVLLSLSKKTHYSPATQKNYLKIIENSGQTSDKLFRLDSWEKFIQQKKTFKASRSTYGKGYLNSPIGKWVELVDDKKIGLQVSAGIADRKLSAINLYIDLPKDKNVSKECASGLDGLRDKNPDALALMNGYDETFGGYLIDSVALTGVSCDKRNHHMRIQVFAYDDVSKFESLFHGDLLFRALKQINQSGTELNLLKEEFEKEKEFQNHEREYISSLSSFSKLCPDPMISMAKNVVPREFGLELILTLEEKLSFLKDRGVKYKLNIPDQCRTKVDELQGKLAERVDRESRKFQKVVATGKKMGVGGIYLGAKDNSDDRLPNNPSIPVSISVPELKDQLSKYGRVDTLGYFRKGNSDSEVELVSVFVAVNRSKGVGSMCDEIMSPRVSKLSSLGFYRDKSKSRAQSARSLERQEVFFSGAEQLLIKCNESRFEMELKQRPDETPIFYLQ